MDKSGDRQGQGRGGSGGTRPRGASGSTDGRPATSAGGKAGQQTSSAGPNSTAVGEPVDVGTGDMFLSETDVRVEGRLPLVLARRHVSGWRIGQWFGPTWSSTLDARLEISTGTVRLITADAQIISFAAPEEPESSGTAADPHPAEWPADTPVLTAAGAPWELSPVGSRPAFEGTEVVVPEVFLTPARLWCAREPDTDVLWWFTETSPATEESLTGTAVLAGTSTLDGCQWTTVEYHPGQQIPAALVQSDGTRILIDTQDGLIAGYRLHGYEPQVDNHVPAHARPGADGLIRSFTYDQDRRLIEVADPDASVHRFAYDGAGRIVRWEDRIGHHYAYRYDVWGRVVAGEGTDGVLNVAIEYQDTPGHGDGRRLRRVTDACGAVTVYDIDRRGLVTAITDPTGARTTYARDHRGELTLVNDPLGRITQAVRDERGRMLSVTGPDGARTHRTRDRCGRVETVTDPVGTRTRYAWDTAGHCLSITDALGAATHFEYDPLAGSLAQVTDPLGAITQISTDRAGRPITVLDSDGGANRYGYTPFGHLAWHSDPEQARTTWQRTITGLPVEQILADGTRTTWTYDAEENLLTTTDPNGGQTHYTPGPLGLTTALKRPDGAFIQVRHDGQKRPIEVIDPRGLSWTYSYDAAGRLAEQRDYDDVLTRYTYDAAGQLAQRIQSADTPEAITTSHSWDLAGRLVSTIHQDEHNSRSTRYTYDDAGRMTQAVNDDHTLAFTFDILGRTLTESVDGRTVASTYDTRGQRTGRTLPDGTATTWEWKPSGLPSSITTGQHQITFAHDLSGRTTSIAHQIAAPGPGPHRSFVTEQQYDPAGRLLTQVASLTQLSPGLPTNNPAQPGISSIFETLTGNPQTPATPALPATSASQVLHTRHYDWRPDGYLNTIQDSTTGRQDFELDPLGRVTHITYNGKSAERYAYDASGSLIQSHQSAAADNQDAPWAESSGALTYAVSRVTRVGNTSYTYDTHGRLTRRTTHLLSGTIRRTHFAWNPEGTLAAATIDGVTWHYTYDPLGRRVTKGSETAEVSVQVFTWDGPTLAAESLPDGGTRTFSYIPGSYTPIAQTTGAANHQLKVRAVLTDTVGTPIHLADPVTGHITWTRRTTHWGIPRQRVNIDTSEYCPLDHPGQYRDPETDNHYNHYRYYDPTTASTDPLGLAPDSNNRGYVCNPQTWIDPLGLSSQNSCATPASDSLSLVPVESLEVIASIEKDGVIAQSGVRGPVVPKEFRNDGGTGGQVLPSATTSGAPIKYREWGTIPSAANERPGGERIVTGSDGATYYSPDHYQTFVRVS
ncbi:DUF6531 domain-containing protein [Kineosporia babensis]|nr:DUF6531 domain-containing protein [Kineosporia babensis]